MNDNVDIANGDGSLRDKILQLLKDNGGRMLKDEVCARLKISYRDVPCGYNIGWASCLQPDQTFMLIQSACISNIYNVVPSDVTGRNCC
jgi:hypothetical protein